jgi:hypothetical protein
MSSGKRPNNLFQLFFEKALGLKEKDKQKKKRVSKTKASKIKMTPRVSFNPMVAMLGIQPKGMDCDKEFVAFPNAILRIDNDHFSTNRILENRELFSKSKLSYMDIQNLLSLEFDKGWQYKIILEGGLLLCQLRNIYQERDNLLKHIKLFIKKAVRSSRENLEELESVVNCVVPFTNHPDEEKSTNPLLSILVNTLYKDIKKIKEAFQMAKEQTFTAEQ